MSPVQAVCLCVFVISASRVSHRCCTTAVPHGEQLSARFPPRDNRMMFTHRGAHFRPGHALRAAVLPGGCSFSGAGGCFSVSAEQQLIKTLSVRHFHGIFRFTVWDCSVSPVGFTSHCRSHPTLLIQITFLLLLVVMLHRVCVFKCVLS